MKKMYSINKSKNLSQIVLLTNIKKRKNVKPYFKLIKE